MTHRELFSDARWLSPKGDADAALFRATFTNNKAQSAEITICGLGYFILYINGQPAAMTLGSFLTEQTFDVQFEKALEEADGAYPAINNAFACYLREKYPSLRWLNREDDLGLEGLRKAKLSYCPDHMIEKRWACLLEDGYDY